MTYLSLKAPTRLYIKQCSHCNLKYYGKHEGQNIESYIGSGVYWNDHLEYHNSESIHVWHSDWYYDESIKEDALKFSIDNNITESSEWANLKAENGIDGGDNSKFIDYEKRNFYKENNPFYGKKHTEENKKKQGIHRIGVPPANKGISPTEEQRAKMRGPRPHTRGPRGKVGPTAALKAWETKRRKSQELLAAQQTTQ